jgi:gluconokinase
MSHPLPADALVLAIDVGTSSVRAMIFDRQGSAHQGVFSQIRYLPETTSDGGSTIDPRLLSQIIFECIDGALQQAGSAASRIGAVVMDTLVSNLLGVDSHSAPTTPIFTWADTRGGPLAAVLKNQLSPAAFTERTGCRIHTSNWPVRLLWVKETQPEVFSHTAHWLSIGDYLLFQVFGQRRVSLSAASWSGVLNRNQGDWDSETLAVLPVSRDQLSAISDEPLQGLSGQWAARWPALKAALWFPAIGDGVASNIGAGCATPQHVAISVGTSGAMRIVVPGRPSPVPDGLFGYCVDAHRSLIGGSLSNAGNLYAWLRRVLNVTPDAQTTIAALAPDSHGLTILPFLAGERAPGRNEKAKAVFLGMTFDTGPEHLVRAALEAISYRFYQIARRLAPLVAPGAIYVASGGPVLQSPLWMQILADVLGAPVYASAEAEATIRGAVFVALGEDMPPRLGQGYQPEPARHEIYMNAVARQEVLYDRLLR